jgi:hypothetical protein
VTAGLPHLAEAKGLDEPNEILTPDVREIAALQSLEQSLWRHEFLGITKTGGSPVREERANDDETVQLASASRCSHWRAEPVRRNE